METSEAYRDDILFIMGRSERGGSGITTAMKAGMDQTVEILGKLMDAAVMRQEVLAGNLANVNTPNYHRKDIKFQDALAAAIGSPDKMKRLQPELIEDVESPSNSQGNNVSLQQELSKMTQNGLLFDFAAEMTSLKFAGLRKAITGTK